jgi:hypothetical protein
MISKKFVKSNLSVQIPTGEDYRRCLIISRGNKPTIFSKSTAARQNLAQLQSSSQLA